jgi:4-diphosphocytidyl-2-C-methyl-D-erythritol kinase
VKIRAPAKINFGLRVVGKRADGYHLLDTIMLPVSLYDDVRIDEVSRLSGKSTKQEDRLTVTCDDPSVPSGENNLAYKAASLLLNRAKIDPAVRISIRKRIPVGAGLGGGSTDAGATLVGLNRLFRLRYTSKQLEGLAYELGADVPFFIKAVPARARGIGERLTVLKKVPRLWLIILYPNFAVSSAWVYRNFGAKLTKPMVNTSITFSLSDAGKLKKLLANDLETVAMNRYPRIGLLKQELAREGAVGALMSGSGSSVFGVFQSRRSAADAFRRLRKEEGVQAFLVRVLS